MKWTKINFLTLNLITEISNYTIFSLIFLFLLSLISLRVTTNFEKILNEIKKEDFLKKLNPVYETIKDIISKELIIDFHQ